MNGTWNGELYITHPGEKQPQLYFNARTAQRAKRLVRPLDQCEPKESRRCDAIARSRLAILTAAS